MQNLEIGDKVLYKQKAAAMRAVEPPPIQTKPRPITPVSDDDADDEFAEDKKTKDKATTGRIKKTTHGFT